MIGEGGRSPPLMRASMEIAPAMTQHKPSPFMRTCWKARDSWIDGKHPVVRKHEVIFLPPAL
jgi:hypothetical protein